MLTSEQRKRLDAASAGGWNPDGTVPVLVSDLREALRTIDAGAPDVPEVLRQLALDVERGSRS